MARRHPIIELAMLVFITPVIAQLNNADFEDGLTGWTVNGSVTVDDTLPNNVAIFREDPAAEKSRIYQVFTLPVGAQTLSFDYGLYWYSSVNEDGVVASTPGSESNSDAAIPRYRLRGSTLTGSIAGFPNDSFSAFLLDPITLERILPKPDEPVLNVDDFFFADNTGLIDVNSNYVTVSSPDADGVRTVTIDVSSLPGGTELHLEFGLAGGPDGLTTMAILDNIAFSVDCNQNGVPDECDIDPLCTPASGLKSNRIDRSNWINQVERATSYRTAQGGPAGGPVLIGGDDADDHGSFNNGANQAGWLYIEDGFNLIGSQVGNGNQLAVCLGCNFGSATGAFESGFDQSDLPAAGWSRISLIDPADIAAFFDGTGGTTLANTGIIYMPTDMVDLNSGLTDEQLVIINANAGEINDFVANGGGLFAHAQQSTIGFGWLATLIPGIAFSDQNCALDPNCDDRILTLTTEGQLAFPSLTNAIITNATPWHRWFSGNFGGLSVLATGVVGGVDRPVILGCVNCRLQQFVELTPRTATNRVGTTHMLIASVRDALNRPVVGAVVTFEILAGPNVGTSGMSVTAADGTATFQYVGIGQDGVDEIMASFFDGAETQFSNVAYKTWYGSLDCNHDEVPDDCQMFGVCYPSGNIGVDPDFVSFTTCIGGPDEQYGAQCSCSDFDGDDDVDLADAAIFELLFPGCVLTSP